VYLYLQTVYCNRGRGINTGRMLWLVGCLFFDVDHSDDFLLEHEK
jgi:hypothetical protein